MQLNNIENILIIGTGDIGGSLIDLLESEYPKAKVFATTRNSTKVDDEYIYYLNPVDENSWKDFQNRIENKITHFDLIISTLGILTTDRIKPEKRIEDIEIDSLINSFSVNAFSAALAAKYLLPYISKNQPSTIAFLSAKVGSISDNSIGGWYSYRSSKAALNMIVKNLSIELKRRNYPVTLLSIHPGTTYSNLSNKYLHNIKHKVWQPNETAQHILEVIKNSNSEESGCFKNWDGEIIPW